MYCASELSMKTQPPMEDDSWAGDTLQAPVLAVGCYSTVCVPTDTINPNYV